VLRAARLIRSGEVIELGHVLSSTMPLSAGRRFELETKRTTMSPQSNRRGSNEELVVAEIGQVGTQFDGFAHQTVGNSLYNCFKVDEVSTRTGFTKLGIQNVGALVTRGVPRVIPVISHTRPPTEKGQLRGRPGTVEKNDPALGAVPVKSGRATVPRNSRITAEAAKRRRREV